jgi:site-specific recombinase XerD
VDTPSAATENEPRREEAQHWVERFLDDLAVVRSSNTVRAYWHDLARWIAFCSSARIDPLQVRPGDVIAFIRHERERSIGDSATVSARTIVRRLSAIRQWYAFLLLEPEVTGVRRNPVPAGTSLRAAAGIVAGQPALLRYDQPLPKTLSAADMDHFIAHLTATVYRDRCLVWLLKDGGLRIHEVLDLRLGDIHWSKAAVTVRSAKSRTTRLVPLSADAVALLGAYIRDERPLDLDHDHVFVCLGRRSFGKPLTYRAWAYICQRARQAADTPNVHAHAFRHTCATNLAEAGMPLDALQRLLGHRHPDTTMLYNRVRDGRLHREYREAMAVQEADRQPARGEDR